MTDFCVSGGKTNDRARAGRRFDDPPAETHGAVRDRRRVPLQPLAAAQSVVMANVAEPSAPRCTDIASTAAAGYAAAKPRKTEAEVRREAFMAEADAQQQAAHQAWIAHRRSGGAVRNTDVEDAVIVSARRPL